MIRRTFLIMALVFVAFQTRAEHIVGGEMYYECMGDGEYLITMKLYRDCASSGAPFDNPANFGLFDADNNLVDQFSAFGANISPIIPDLSSPCLALPPDICLEEGTYEFMINVPDPTQEYQIVYQRCCRNQTIQNLVDPGAQGITIVATIPGTDIVDCNSKAFFNNFPPPVLCAQEPLFFDHSATDPDGDSLAYTLCSPFIGGTQDIPAPVPPSNPPYDQVIWGAGFSTGFPLNSDPPMSIDPITGLLTGTPTQLGQFVIGVCVEEWRDGVLLSTNTRDFQFNVAFCEQTSDAIIAEPEPADVCDDLIFQFENLSSPGNTFVWDFGDPTTDDDVSGAYNPSYTYPDTGFYVVTLITNPGFFCSDTAYLELPLYNETVIDVQIAEFECINGQQIFTFAAAGIFDTNGATVQWDFGENATPQMATGLQAEGITFSTLGPQSVFVEVLDNICTAESDVTINIPSPPEILINPQEVFCDGLTYTFTQESENASIFLWDFGEDPDDADQSQNAQPSYTYNEPGTYTVTLTGSDPDNCPVTVTETFDILPLLAPEIEENPIACFDDNAIDFNAAGVYGPGAEFDWTFEGTGQGGSSAENPSGINYLAPGIFPVQLSVTENGCTRIADGEMIIHANPFALFTANLFEGCAPLTVNFINESFSESSSIAYDWNFGDGNTGDFKNESNIYTEPGQYTVSMSLENLNGCIDSDQFTLETPITVHPSPTASFKIDPPTVSTFNPEVNLIDRSIGAISCTYYFDGQEFDGCDVTHLLENVEPQVIAQTVINEFGCIDRVEGELFISDHQIFIPNAFTPDGDGLNDLFLPVTAGVQNLRMQIFDRWGQLIYNSDNEMRGWDGSSPTDGYFAQSGQYAYLITVTDFGGWNFEYTGAINLLR